MFKSLLMFMSVSVFVGACNQGSNSAARNGTGSAGESTGGTKGSAPVISALPNGVSLANVKMAFDAFTATPTIYVRSTADNVCIPFTLKVTNSGAPLEGATIALTASTTTSTMKDLGEIVTTSTKTTAEGEVEGTYCSGDAEGVVILVAELSGLTTNSETIRVTVKPVYKLEYSRSDIDPALTPAEGPDAGALYLNLVDSGPQDCTNVYFKLTKSDKVITGSKLTFRSQIDFPAGSKFAKKADTVKTAIDAGTNKKYLTYESYTNGAGEAAVPVCAGVFLGSIDVAAKFTDDEGKSYETHSPIVRIVGGLSNWVNMSLTYNETNGRTLKDYFSTNSKYSLPITANIGSRMDGMPIKQYPLMVAAETGRVTVANGGFIDPEKGTVDFSIQALHLVDNYPYFVYPFDNIVAAQTRCSPQKIAEWGQANSKTYVNYTDVAKNWRSTIVYYIRGQEHYRDANGNGKYDEGGDGFWDRNQNGYYDSEDILTYDAGNDGKFDPNSEWFIDLPTPFIDVNEDKVYTAGVDILIGEKYEAPNGKRDADTTIWKYDVLPISMGPSDYSMTHYRIESANYNNTDTTVTLNGVSYPIFSTIPILTPNTFWGNTIANYGNAAFYDFVIYAHDLCGSLLPGGTKLTMSAMQTNAALESGTFVRAPTLNWVSTPEDRYLEPTRRLLSRDTDLRQDGSMSTSAVINFNAIDHPSKDMGYPIMGRITVPACVHSCTGAVNTADPGTYCSAWQGYINVNISEPALASDIDSSTTNMNTYINLPRVQACKCIGGSSLSTTTAGTCECPTGQTFTAGVCQ